MQQSWRSLAFSVSICAGATLAAGLIVASQFPAGGNDDSHITYWSAHALAKYGEIVSYNGSPVEQSSSFTLVAILALAHGVSGVSLPTLGWAQSLVFGTLGISLAYVLARKDTPRAAAWCPVLLGTWLPFLYWSSSGMEMTLVASLGAALAILAGSAIDTPAKGYRAVAMLAVVGALFALARPETPLELVAGGGLVATAAVFRASRNASAEVQCRRRRALVAFASMTVGVAGIAGVRYLAFGLLVPNSAAAKTGAMSLAHGASYLAKGIDLSNVALPLSAAVGGGMVVMDAILRRASTAAVFILGWGIASLGFVIGSGGDWMPGARLLVPLGIPLAYLTTRAAEFARAKIGRWAHVLPATLVVLNVFNCLNFARSRSNNSYTWERASAASVVDELGRQQYAFSELANKAHRRDAKLLGPLMEIVRRARPKQERPLYIMSGQAGMVPFHVFKEFYGAVRFIDLYALTTPELLPCVPAKARTYQVQGVRISAAYVIDHADDMHERCRAKSPGIVYSTGRYPDYLRQRGYERIYQGPRDLEAFIAVEAALADEIKKNQ